MKKKIIFVNKAQYGYHSDTYYYCKYLKDEYDVTYLGFDAGHDKVEGDIRVIYVQRGGSKFVNAYRFFANTLLTLRKNSFEKIVLVYFPFCSIFSFFYKDRAVCDVRTLSVSANKYIRSFFDGLMRLELKFFKEVSVISEGVKKKLNLKNSVILPLGAEVFTDLNRDGYKKNDVLRLFYIGTFNGRRIIDTIKAASYLHQNGVSLVYDIVGFGDNNEIDVIINEISKLPDGVVRYHGRLSHVECKNLFSESHVGFCYYPIVDFYQEQPPTKLFEYVLNGIYCIAVNTKENCKHITSTNGCIVDDNVNSLILALEMVLDKNTLDRVAISKTLSSNTWEYIVENQLKPILKGFHE
ncbi:hypothetical protein NDN17_08875 [Shewanella algae]|uniref:hypothetical protein n=1 Tax=Shewanella algae TaxID=38313 RepID=UPI0020353979|nr:hypothetical protein [Shewanella algae]MCM2528632.1 hypothetical protein [Shewanella algae]